jgi:hypothetical protein
MRRAVIYVALIDGHISVSGLAVILPAPRLLQSGLGVGLVSVDDRATLRGRLIRMV